METGKAGQQFQPRFLQSRIVIVVEIVEADDRLAGFQQPPRHVHADEACRSGYENWTWDMPGLRPCPADRTIARNNQITGFLSPVEGRRIGNLPVEMRLPERLRKRRRSSPRARSDLTCSDLNQPDLLVDQALGDPEGGGWRLL